MLKDWERAALGLGPSDEIPVALSLEAQVDKLDRTSGTAWWVSAFYAPDIWRVWRVGLVRGSLNLWARHPVTLPNPFVFDLPEKIRNALPVLGKKWARACVCPVIVGKEALGFLIRTPDGDSRFCETFAPTHLSERLGLQPGDEVELDLVANKKLLKC